MYAEKHPIQLDNGSVPGGAKITIANNPDTYEFLPKGAPCQLTASKTNEYALIKGVKVYETATDSTTVKVSKDNLIGVGDSINWEAAEAGAVTSIDYSNDDYDILTLDTAVTATLNTVYNETVSTKVFFTNGTIKIYDDVALTGVLYDGIVDLAKLNLHANVTASDLGGKVSLISDIR